VHVVPIVYNLWLRFLLTTVTEPILNKTASCHWAWRSVATQFDIQTHISVFTLFKAWFVPFNLLS